MSRLTVTVPASISGLDHDLYLVTEDQADVPDPSVLAAPIRATSVGGANAVRTALDAAP